jgi:LPXTG-site transpeptidase (sortase) family protein
LVSGRSGDSERARLFLISLASLLLFASIGVFSVAAYELAQPGGDSAEVQTLAPDVFQTPRPKTASPSPVPTPSPAPTPFFASKPFRIAIDKLGVDAPVVAEGMDANQVPLVPLNSYEVAWYDFTAAPGTPGNTVFAGHKTWGGEAVFYDLDQLQRGDVIRLTGDDGSELVYTVTDSFTVREDDPNAVS